MVDINNNNKRIAKNTLLLYGRMLIMMIVSLYTSRIVLNVLGLDDYGIYNVVGGVVTMFTILSSSLSAAISRFITFELGKGNSERLKSVFCTAMNVQILLIIIITILLETVGLLILNHLLVIPSDRMIAANWVFQFSIITFAINLWSIPYNAAIIAHEHMSAFAYIGIFDAAAKLGIAYLIKLNPIDRLIYFALLVLLVGVIQRLLYSFYCKKRFEECQYHFTYDRQITKEMFGFAGWNFIGSASAILRDQGGNFILNLFGGPVVNAAHGVAMSVNNAVSSFVSNFMTALNPQITKNYASGNREYMFKLAFQGSRLSYYILLIIVLPIIFTAPYLLKLWLGIVPDHASNFVCLVLLFTLSECLANPLITIMLATGKIRNYQLLIGGIQLMNLPISYTLLQFGYPLESIFVVAIIISILSEMARLFMLKSMVGLSVGSFLKCVYFNVIIVTSLSALFPYTLIKIIPLISFYNFITIVLITVISTIGIIYFIGCSKQDKTIINSTIMILLKRFSK